RHAEALALAREAITTAEAAGAKLLLADALEQHGRARTGLGESDAALEDLMRAAGMYRELAVKAKEAEALHGMALAAASAGRLEEAVDHGEAALATLETVRGSVSDPELRAYYAAARRTYYETQIDMLMALHSASASGAADRFMRAAFETSERSRARML